MKIPLKNLYILPALIAGLGLVLAGRVAAQTFTNLYNFNGGDGADPHAGLVFSGNTLFGATDGGSSSGTVFAINTNDSGFTNLYSFTGGSDGNGPDGTLLLSGTNLYGTVFDGGTNDNGAVFKVSTNGTGFKNLYSFTAVNGNNINSDGANPEVGLVLSGNTLYGETTSGGSAGYGTVFKVNTDGTGFKNLYSFTNGSDGSIPEGLVISGNTLFGASLGISGNGTVFALNTNGTGFTILHSFPATNFTVPSDGPTPPPGYANNDGVGPTGLILSGSTLYGTAVWGGTNGNGTVFAINTNGTGFATLHSFAATAGANYTDSEGAHPIAFSGLVLSGNTLYGTALFGGSAGNGTVFSLNTNGSGFTTLYNFTATDVTGYNNDGANPYAGLTLSGNTLYGTAQNGGTNGDGTVFSISLALVVTTTSLPSGTNGVAYNQTLAAYGGQKPYSWTTSSGALPPGLTLATNGVISGTPTASGTNNFTVKVTGSLSATATQPLTLTVGSPPSIVAMQPPNGSVTVPVGGNVTFTVSVAGTGPFSYQWQLDGTNLPNGIITTVAGSTNYVLGDGGAAINADLVNPADVAVDVAGNLFIADTDDNRIRKVDTNGIIRTVAGGGSNYPGDGGAATNALLGDPTGVAMDATGNLFIADTDNNRIRKVDTNGIITTVAGNGRNDYSGDGGAATNAELYAPSGVAVDATGNLFIADKENTVIRKVGINGIITTVAGGGFNYPGDGGVATNAELGYPTSVAVDATGDLFIADTDNYRIRKVDTNGIITTVAGGGFNYPGDGGAATNAELNGPSDVAVDATGNLFIADTRNNRIRKVDTNGIITTGAGNGTESFSGDGGAATNAELNWPSGVAVDATGNLFIADSGNYRIRTVIFPGLTLVLNDVGFGNAGTYDVVVSGPYGSVTATWNLSTGIILSAPQVTAKTNFTFVLSGPAGNYVLLASTNLVNWSSVSTSTMPVSGTMTLTNTISGYNRRFYRVYLQ